VFRVIVCRITIGLLTSVTCHNGCNNLIINKKDISRSGWVSGRILSGFLSLIKDDVIAMFEISMQKNIDCLASVLGLLRWF
jgi:hypothetical protein